MCVSTADMGPDEIAARRRKQCDFAYGCFFLTGLFSLVVGFADIFPQSNTGFFALLIGLWLAIPSCVAAVVGIVLSAKLWRHWPLPFLSLLMALVLVVAATETGPITFYKATPIAYGITCMVFVLAWFLRFRKFF